MTSPENSPEGLDEIAPIGYVKPSEEGGGMRFPKPHTQHFFWVFLSGAFFACLSQIIVARIITPEPLNSSTVFQALFYLAMITLSIRESMRLETNE